MLSRKLSSALLLALAIQSPLHAANGAVNETAPVFSQQQIDGETFDLSQYRGNSPVLLKFWATWCSYCLEEMPHLQAMQDSYGDKLKVLTINVGINDSVSNVQQLFKKNRYSLPVVFDQSGELTARYGVIGTPSQVLIDKDGLVSYRSNLTTDALEAKIAQLTSQ